MKIVIEKNIEACKKLWEKLSPYETLWDEWGVIAPLYHADQFEPYFLVLENDHGQSCGLLPLWLEKELDRYYTFGGDYMEDLRFWFEPQYFPLFFEQLPATKLFDVNALACQKIMELFPEYEKYFELVHSRYFLKPAKFDYQIEKYLELFGKKHRYNLLYDLKKLEELNYELVWETVEHFDDFVKFNLERFGDESDFIEPQFIEEMRQIVNYLAKQDQLKTLTIKIDGRVVGVEIACEFKNVWYVLNGGQASDVPNVGKLLLMEHIKEAFTRKCDEVNFLAGDTGWKENWHLDKEQYYNFASPSYTLVEE